MLILGAGSAIAEAYARIIAGEGRPLLLAARDPALLEKMVSDLTARGAPAVTPVVSDLAELDRIPTLWSEITEAHGCPSEVFLAYGTLGDMAPVKAGGDALATHLRVNFTSACLWLAEAAMAMEDVGKGRIVAIGSVAGDRGRQSNYPYGAAKAGLAAYVAGLQHRFARGGGAVSAHFVKPGFVDTPMTDGMDKGGPLWASPESVAKSVRRAILRGRATVYVPWFWAIIMLIIRSVPRAILHRTGL